ncbi:MAG: hypothetical protein HUK26_09910, partial [Duodenibacillus sp.]|nr:hypothetical protein [Duodenibacillus sp.]
MPKPEEPAGAREAVSAVCRLLGEISPYRAGAAEALRRRLAACPEVRKLWPRWRKSFPGLSSEEAFAELLAADLPDVPKALAVASRLHAAGRGEAERVLGAMAGRTPYAFEGLAAAIAGRGDALLPAPRGLITSEQIFRLGLAAIASRPSIALDEVIAFFTGPDYAEEPVFAEALQEFAREALASGKHLAPPSKKSLLAAVARKLTAERMTALAVALQLLLQAED